MAEMKRLQEDMMKAVNGIFTEIKSMREEMKRMQTTEVKQNGSNRRATSRKYIIAVGGFNKESLASAERFSWRQGEWKPLSELNESRYAASAVVFQNQLLVCGGKNNVTGTDSIEKLNLNQKPEQWLDFPAKLPLKCRGHKCVVYGNRLFCIGGYTNQLQASDGIYELLLIPPYSSKLLCRMKLKRCYHGVELFDDTIFIVGGKTSLAFQESVSNVEMYGITKNECKKMPPLPFPVCRMATVGWDDNVIVIGGSDKNNYDVNAVIAYDIKTGVSKELPSMKNERSACAAVVSGDRIVVMGGVNLPRTLDSVECFDFFSYSWIELTPMIEPRQQVSAILSSL